MSTPGRLPQPTAMFRQAPGSKNPTLPPIAIPSPLAHSFELAYPETSRLEECDSACQERGQCVSPNADEVRACLVDLLRAAGAVILALWRAPHRRPLRDHARTTRTAAPPMNSMPGHAEHRVICFRLSAISTRDFICLGAHPLLHVLPLLWRDFGHRCGVSYR